jgi:hypothetical protein
MNGDHRIAQIELQDAIGAIERTVEVGVDDEIVAPDIAGSAGTGFHIPAFLIGNQQQFFSFPDRISRKKDISDQFSRVLD